MAAAQQQKDNEDLTMEEILQSIRKIIADENDSPAGDAPSTAATGETTMAQDKDFFEETMNAGGSDVLELTDVMDDFTPQEAAASVDVLKEIDDALDMQSAPPLAAEPPPPPAAPAYVAATPEATNAEKLLSDNAAHISASHFKKMLETHKATTPIPHLRSGITIEDLVLESMKPMLKEWLDTNLPSMVERIVEREIRKLVD